MSDNNDNKFQRYIAQEKTYSGAVSADGMAIVVLEYLDQATDWRAAMGIRSTGRAGDNEAALAYALYLLLRNRSSEDVSMGLRELSSLTMKGHPFSQYILAKCKEMHWYCGQWYAGEATSLYIKAAKSGYRRAAMNALTNMEKGDYVCTKEEIDEIRSLILPEAPAETAAREEIERRLAERC